MIGNIQGMPRTFPNLLLISYVLAGMLLWPQPERNVGQILAFVRFKDIFSNMVLSLQSERHAEAMQLWPKV